MKALAAPSAVALSSLLVFRVPEIDKGWPAGKNLFERM
jgi:hypothetical protein